MIFFYRFGDLSKPLISPWEVTEVLRLAQKDVERLAEEKGPMNQKDYILFTRYELFHRNVKVKVFILFIFKGAFHGYSINTGNSNCPLVQL